MLIFYFFYFFFLEKQGDLLGSPQVIRRLREATRVFSLTWFVKKQTSHRAMVLVMLSVEEFFSSTSEHRLDRRWWIGCLHVSTSKRHNVIDGQKNGVR